MVLKLRTVPIGAALLRQVVPYRFRARRDQLERFCQEKSFARKNSSSKGQDLAVTVLCVPNSLNSGWESGAHLETGPLDSVHFALPCQVVPQRLMGAASVGKIRRRLEG